MSYDISLTINTGIKDAVVADAGNYTWNVAPMLYDTNDGWERITKNNVSSKTASEILEKILVRLVENPGKYRAMNPKNGWGDYDSMLAWLQNLKEICDENPLCTVRVS